MDNFLQRGQTMLLMVLIVTIISSTLIFGLNRPIVDEIKMSSELLRSRQSFFLAEAAAEDMAYRFINSFGTFSNSTITLGGNTAQAIVTDVGGSKIINSQGNVKNAKRKASIVLDAGSGMSFPYGIHVGIEGLYFNFGRINGSVFSNGPIVGTGSNFNNMIMGDAISAGNAGLIDNVKVFKSAYAHNINEAAIEEDAYYGCPTCLTGTGFFTYVHGDSFPNSPDQELVPPPLSDETLDGWETDIEALGVINVSCPGGTYTVPTFASFGPGKLNCNLVISGGTIVTIDGPVWVNGNITINGNLSVDTSPSLLNQSVLLIADNPSNRTTGSKIDVSGSAQLHGYGSNGRIVLTSRNRSAEDGGAEIAINSVGAPVGEFSLYAPHGHIKLEGAQIVTLDGLSARKLTISGPTVNYQTGIQNPLFTLGPEGGYHIADWNEVR